MTSFSTKHVALVRTPDNPAYWWNVKFDLSFQNGTVTVGVDIKLTGETTEVQSAWLAGIKAIWNERAFLTDGSQLYDVKFNVRYVASGEDQVVDVHGLGDGQGHFDMNDFWVNSDWGPSYYDVSAAHEFGHMIGNYDEYYTEDPDTHAHIYTSTKDHYTPPNTLMNNLDPNGGFEKYFDTIQKQTEIYGFAGHNVLSTVLATRGYDFAETMTGTSGMDGIYGNGGADSISGYDKNDFLDGGNDNDTIFGGTGNDRLFGRSGADWLLGDGGNDTLTGGAGSDSMDGGANKDRFVFDTKLSASSNVDTINGFSHADDTIALTAAVFSKVGGAIESGEFYGAAGASKAHDSSDRIVYNSSNGWLYYDDDGNKAHGRAAVHFATLSNHPSNVSYTDFIVV